jgi:hypothetical protein
MSTDTQDIPIGPLHTGEHPHSKEPRLRDIPLTPKHIFSLPLLALLRFYQLTLARAIPANTCRFYPTCSHYAYRAIYKHGPIKGTLMAAWRLLRCNPFNPGGFDPVP